jgi:hypothetical protein
LKLFLRVLFSFYHFYWLKSIKLCTKISRFVTLYKYANIITHTSFSQSLYVPSEYMHLWVMTSFKLNSSLGSLACCDLNEGTMAPFHFILEVYFVLASSTVCLHSCAKM